MMTRKNESFKKQTKNRNLKKFNLQQINPNKTASNLCPACYIWPA